MSPIGSYLFEFLVTPAGTTTLEVVGWIAFLTLLIYGDRRRIRNSAEKPKVPEERTAYVTPSLAHPQLRRRPIAHVDGTVDGTISFDVNATDAARPTPAAPASSLPFSSKLKYYATLTIIAYILDAALFLMISIAMHKSILFIPTPCSNATTVNDACDYSFGFDREFYLVNPSTNDTIHLVYIKGKESKSRRQRKPILFTHGNSYNLAHPDFVQQYTSLQSLGNDVFAWDYPDYGKSRLSPGGRMTLQRFHQDAEFVLEKVSQLSSVDSKRVVLWGFSMGGAISATLSVQRPVNALILQFPPDRFDWIVREGTKLTGWLSALPQYKILDLFSLLVHIRTPTRVLHLAAELDHYVTHARQERLFAQLAPHVRAQSHFFTVAGVGHNGNPLNDPKLPAVLDAFLSDDI